MEVDQKILNLACNGISNNEPCGINAKYEPAFEKLEAEIAKSESLSSESTDWNDVLVLCEEILTSVSKDYSVACYLAYSYLQADGYKGLLNGITLLEKMSETFWDDMYPPKKRLRGRQNATQWLIEKVAPIINDKEPSPEEMQCIPELAKALKNLDYLLAEKMEDKAPNFGDINRPIKRLKEIASQQAVAKPEPEQAESQATAPVEPKADTQAPTEATQLETTQAEPPAQPTIPVPAATPKPVPQAAASNQTTAAKPAINVEKLDGVGNDNEAKKAYKQIQDNLRKLANYYGQAKASDPKRFRLSRSALWDGLDKLPPVTDNKTQLPAPPADKLKKVVDLFEAGEFLEAINLAEKSAEKMPYWFAGNRYIFLSLEALGPEYSKAKQALEFELCKFIARLPKILDLMYADGTPFTDEQTKAWLLSLGAQGQESSPVTSEQDVIQEAFMDAKKLALSGKLSEGFGLLNSCPVTTKRDKFKVKMACAELACINGQVKVGIPMLERLIEETRSLTVADWESDFLAKALALLVNAYEKLNEEESLEKQKQIDAAYDQLCWYNPALLTD